MIFSIFRILGGALFLLAVVALNYDFTKTLDGRALHLTSFGDAWFAVHRESLLLAQPAIERHIAPWLWNPVIQTVLEQPTWLVLGILGAILVLIGRKKKPLVGYARGD